MSADSKHAPSESRLQYALAKINSAFPTGVSHLLIGYFIDEVTITAEYNAAVFEDNVELLQFIDKEYNAFLHNVRSSSVAPVAEDLDLYISAINAGAKKSAAYLRERVKKGGFWRNLLQGELVNEEALRDYMDLADKKDLEEALQEALDNSDTLFVKLFLQRFPQYKLVTNVEEEKGVGIPRLDAVSAHMVYILLRYANKEDLKKSMDYDLKTAPVALRASSCLFFYTCNLPYTICKCRRCFLLGTREVCNECIKEERKRKEDEERRRNPPKGCAYIFVRGARSGLPCGAPVIPGSNYCNACKGKTGARPLCLPGL